MRTIIAGSRNIEDYWTVDAAVKESGFNVTEIFSGHARGVDLLGERYADNHRIPKRIFPAKWDAHGVRAGILRNIRMSEEADALIAVWDGLSGGTLHMIRQANKKGLKVFVKTIGPAKELQEKQP